MTTLTQAAQSARDAVRSEDARLAILRQDAQQIQDSLDQAETDRQKAEKRINDLRDLAVQQSTAIAAQEVVCQQARGLAEAVGELGITVPEAEKAEGLLPTEAEARQHYLDDPSKTAAFPAVATGDGQELVVRNPDATADQEQVLDRRQTRRNR